MANKKDKKAKKLASAARKTHDSCSSDEDTPKETVLNTISIEDNRPKASPYKAPALTFEIGPSGESYSVPRIYAMQSPQWTFSTTSFNIFNTKTVELPDVDEDIGHTLVHYLYTGAYQTLNLQGVSDCNHSVTEYQRASLTYCTAKKYELHGLADHAIHHMELFEKGLSLFQILDIAKDVYPKLSTDESWFPGYLMKKIETTYEADKTIFTQKQFLNYIGDAATFSRALAKVMVEILSDKITSLEKQSDLLEEYALPPTTPPPIPLEESADECTPPTPWEESADECALTPLEESADECVPPPPPPEVDDDLPWTGWGSEDKKEKKGEKSDWEEVDALPVTEVDDELPGSGWWSRPKKDKKGKKIASDEEDDTPVREPT